MIAIDPGLSRNQQQIIDLLSQHKLEWRRLYGIQELSLFGSLARNEHVNSAGALAIDWNALLCALEHFTYILYISLRAEADIRTLSPRQIAQAILEVLGPVASRLCASI